MSRTPSAIATAQPVAAPAPTRRHPHPLRWFFILLLTAVASLSIPQVFQAALGAAVRLDAWRRGGTVRIDRIDGSLWEPVVFTRSYLSLATESGASTRVEIAKAEVHFEWKNLFQGSGERWLQRIVLRGVTGKVNIPVDHSPARGAAVAWRDWLPSRSEPALPSAIEAQDIDFIFQSNGDYVRVEDASFAASATDSGELSVPKLTISQPWLHRSFRNVRGKAALQDNRLALAGVQLEKDIVLKSLTTAAVALARGDLDLEADVEAFGGKLKVESATKPAGRGVTFEASGSFEQIDIGKLASFLQLSDAAGGVIKYGQFKFRGPPRDLARAQASLRLDAVNFQWETRQWDSLTLGLTLMERRVGVPQLDLRQGKNELHLSGELTLPDTGQQWWQGEFNTTVDAKIENLTDLSALLLPEFKYAAGRATIEGSIRGRAGEFNGQLLVSGSKITWRNAPIDTLHAAVKLSGREVQIANVELVNGDDYLRGRGLVRFSNPPVYWGELRLVVDDLKTYAAFLQKPVLPEPLAGGAVIDWTGEGSKEGNSGKFLARLRKVRTLGARGQQFHPINADLEATYQSEAMQFSRFALSDDDSVFTANIAVGGKALHVQDVHFLYRGVTQLEGDALLPLDVWQKWPDVSFAQTLSPEVVAHVQLTAKQLDLAAASKLTGWNFPIAGIVDGTFAADGPVKALKLGGALALKDARLPLDWNGNLLDNATAQLAFHDDVLAIEKLTAHHRSGEVQLGGTVRFKDLLAPTLALTLRSERAVLPSANAKLALTLDGPSNAATIGGSAQLTSSLHDVAPAPFSLTPQPASVPPVFQLTEAPWSAWRYDLDATIDGMQGHVLGSARAPVWIPAAR